MIVPRTRLLVAFGLIVPPLVLLATILPGGIIAAVIGIAPFAVLAVTDAIRSRGVLADLRAGLPDMVRLSKDRDETVAMRIGVDSTRPRLLRVGLPFPPEVTATEEQFVQVPAGKGHVEITWECKASRRGRYRLDRVYLEGSSELGMWNVRASAPVACELRVYPDLRPERRVMPALFLRRGALGVHVRRWAGKGREFEKLRDYVPGDDYGEIHWKATAKRGRPVTKVFQIERTQELYIVIDASRLSAREHPSPAGDSVTVTALERYVTAGLVLALAAEGQRDHYGLLTFSNRIETFLRARNGKAHFAACRDAVHALQPRTVSPDFDEVASFIRVQVRKRALIIYLTALDDPVIAESFVRSLRVLDRQHLILAHMLRPQGMEPLFSGAAVESADDLYERLGSHVRWRALAELERVLARLGVRLSLLDNERMSAELVSSYLGVKQRQLL